MKGETKYYAVTDAKFLKFLLHSRLVALTAHWTFQNMLNMDVTELLFKVFIDIILTIIFSIIITTWLPVGLAIVISLLFAHTINFLFNAHIFVVLKFFGDVTHELSEHQRYIEGIKNRLHQEPSIRWAAIYGSMSRGEFKPTSDLDIRLIRNPGFIPGLRACWFVLRERTRAHLNRFPIDFLVFDSPRLLKKNIRIDELPIIIFDTSTVSNK